LETAEELEAVEIEVTDGPVPEVEIKADDD
jgi:hypothetical protein